MIRIKISFLLVLSTAWLFGQQLMEDSLKVDLTTVDVSATRLSTTFRSSAIPISVLKPDFTQKVGVGLKPMIDGTPGIFVMNANNYAQDLRIAIRGFGARSAFGIRGIKIVVDGVPETTPDGQGQLDNLDLFMIERLEIVRGAASSLYGNASGGVIYINSRNQVDTGFVEIHSGFGSFGLQRYDAAYGYSGKKFQAVAHASHARAEGYRQQSGFENNIFHFGWDWTMDKDARLSGTVNYTNAPLGDDAGGLTLEEVEKDRSMARTANVIYKAGETVSQVKANIAFDKKWGDRSSVKLYAFGNSRSFDGRLPFEFDGLIDLDRFYFGQGGHFTLKNNSKKHVDSYLLGYDLTFQKDDRKRYRNLEGEKGDQTLDQTEGFNNQAIYAIGKWTFTRWFAEQSLRVDFNQLKNTDHFLQNGDDSGLINLSNLNFSTGMGFFISSNITLVGRYGTAFETPALSELSANPAGTGGFNGSLSPQSSATLEFSIKGNLRSHLWELTWFDINVKEEILPYELEAFPGRTFFSNSGQTDRKGIELAHAKNWTRYLSSKLAYTFSDFRFEQYNFDGQDYAGLQLPGIPKHMFSWQLDLTHGWIHANLKGQHFSAFFADNGNTEEVARYSLVDISLYRKFRVKSWEVTPYLNVENLFNAEYFDNVRINAFGGRFYEPGPTRQFRAGVKVRVLSKK